MTTLADLDLFDRARHPGLWVENTHGKIGVLIREDREWGIALVQYPKDAVTVWEDPTCLTARHDLPRAWTPDGQPPEGEWLTGGTHTRVIPSGRRAYITMSEPEWEKA